MIIERKDLNPLADRLTKEGLSKKRARRIVYGFFDSTIETLKDGQEVLLPGTEKYYLQKDHDKIKIYPKK